MNIGLQQLLNDKSVKLQNNIYFILMLYKSLYLKDGESRINIFFATLRYSEMVLEEH